MSKKLMALVAGLLVAVSVPGWVRTWQVGHERDAALKANASKQKELDRARDSLKVELAKYRRDSIQAAGRLMNSRRGTDSSFLVLDTVATALEGQVPDSLLEMFRRGVDGLRTHVVDERLHADTVIIVAGEAKATAIALATVNDNRATNLEAKVDIVTRKPPFLVRAFRGVVRIALVGGGTALGAKVGGPVGGAIGAVVGGLVPNQ